MLGIALIDLHPIFLNSDQEKIIAIIPAVGRDNINMPSKHRLKLLDKIHLVKKITTRN